MSKLSVNDGGLIRRAIRSRWNMSDDVRTKAIEICEKALKSDRVPMDEKRKFIKTLTEIDKLNIDEEKIYAPKVNLNLNLSKLKDEDLIAREKELEEQIKQLQEVNQRQQNLIKDQEPVTIEDILSEQDVLDNIKKNNVL